MARNDLKAVPKGLGRSTNTGLESCSPVGLRAIFMGACPTFHAGAAAGSTAGLLDFLIGARCVPGTRLGQPLKSLRKPAC